MKRAKIVEDLREILWRDACLEIDLAVYELEAVQAAIEVSRTLRWEVRRVDNAGRVYFTTSYPSRRNAMQFCRDIRATGRRVRLVRIVAKGTKKARASHDEMAR